MDGQVKISTAADWANKKRNAKTQPLELPSGAVVTVFMSQVAPLLMANVMPMALLSTTNEKDATEDEGLDAKQSMAVSKGYTAISKIVAATVVSPKIIFDDDAIIGPGEISSYDIPFEDLSYLMEYALKSEEAKKLESFRRIGTGNHAGPDVEALQPVTINGNRPG